MIKGSIATNTAGLKNLKRNKIISILRKAIRAGNKIMRAEVKSAVLQATNALRTSISTKVSVKPAYLTATGVIGPRSNYTKTVKGKTTRPARYAHLVDNLKPFLRPSLESKKEAFTNAVNEVLEEEIQKALAGQ